MTTIYLVRHAEAEGNLYRIAHGHYNSCITDDRGCRQIRALAERFRDVPVDAVYASDLIRTRTTAQSIYLPKGLQLHHMDQKWSVSAPIRSIHYLILESNKKL